MLPLSDPTTEDGAMTGFCTYNARGAIIRTDALNFARRHAAGWTDRHGRRIDPALLAQTVHGEHYASRIRLIETLERNCEREDVWVAVCDHCDNFAPAGTVTMRPYPGAFGDRLCAGCALVSGGNGWQTDAEIDARPAALEALRQVTAGTFDPRAGA